MAEAHFVGKITLKALIAKDGKVLLTRDVGDADIWELPGGRLNEGEELFQGLSRELQEELGVRVRVGRLVHSEQFRQSRDGKLALLLAYEVALEDPDADFRMGADEIAEMRWIGPDGSDAQKIYGNCLRALNAYWRK